MKKLWIFWILAWFGTNANAALIGLQNSSPNERTALVGTLTNLGHTVTDTIDGNLDLIIAAPGNGTADFAGVPYLQISDHGADHITNSFTSHPADTPVQITLDGAHPILTGLDPSWTTLGFWTYTTGTDYIGEATSGTGLADATVQGSPFNEVLAVSGTTDIYIGWNVYGPDASPNDLLLLSNSIEFLTTGSVSGTAAEPVPTVPLYGLAVSIMALIWAARRRLRIG